MWCVARVTCLVGIITAETDVEVLWRVDLYTTVRKDEIAPIESGASITVEDIMFVSLEDIMITTLSKTITVFSKRKLLYACIILFPLDSPHNW